MIDKERKRLLSFDLILIGFVTMFLIYGMLIVRKETDNAWGCILIFFVYWNAL